MGFKVFFCRHAFFVLLWKHMKERSRRVAHTVFEIFCGVLFFVVLVCIQHDITEPILVKNRHMNKTWARTTVLYTPDTDTANELMHKLAYNIQRSKSNVGNATDEVLDISSYIGFDTEEKLLDYVSSMNHPEPTFIINFKNNMTGPQLPLQLNYTIGFTDYGSRVMRRHNNVYSENPSVTVGETTALASFQWNIDKTFMEMLSGGPLEEDVVMVQDSQVAPDLRIVRRILSASTLLGPLSFYMFKSSVLVVEKREGLKELMKMHGVSPTILRISHLFDAFFIGIIYSTSVSILLKVTSKPILPHSNPMFVFVTLMLHFINVTCFACVASSLSQDYQHSDSTAFLMYVFTCILDFMWYKKIDSRTFIYFLCCILPHSPIHLFWSEVFYLESIGKGGSFREMFSMHSEKCTPLVLIWVFFLLQVVTLNFIAWYLELVRPGRYGVAAKWNFFCKRRFWCNKKKKVTFHVTVEAKTLLLRDDRYFQKPPKKVELAIKTVGVTKEYVHSRRRKHITTALDSVSLDALKGEITIVLGTNGAGKTTLMSILAGMTSATQGNVYVNGLDTSTRMGELRRDLCLCPQTDHTFKYLTVKENVTFFLRLKKRVAHEKHSAEYLLAKLNLVKKANYYSHQLSSGMRRCLQIHKLYESGNTDAGREFHSLAVRMMNEEAKRFVRKGGTLTTKGWNYKIFWLACALVGDADVLVLDEPTSGMDIGTMHAVWDIFMILRGPKTIIMTTMIMEEADAIADRIALLHNGKLKCYGSPSFLKEALGNQVNLDIALQPKNKFSDVNRIILEQVPEASFVQMDNNILTYRMSSKAKEKLPALFDRLEASQQELGIATMEIGMSMEEIFLRFIQGTEDNLVFYTDETHKTEDGRLHGWRLWRNQLRLLTKRTYMFFWTKKLQFIILQIVVPLLAITFMTLSANYSFGYGEHHSIPEHEVQMFMVYNMGPFTRSHLFNGDDESFLKDIKPIKSDDVRKDVRRIANYHEHYKHSEAVFGYSMEKNRSIIFHAGDSYPLVMRAVNAFSNIFKAIHIPYARNSSIVATYRPIHMRADKLKTIIHPKTIILCLSWAIWTAFFAALPLIPFILFPIKEFHNGVRYNFLLSGCSPVLIWSSKLLAHFSVYLIVIVPCTIVIVICFEFDKTLYEQEFLISISILLSAFGLAFLIQLYVLSYFLNVDHAVSQMYVASLALGLIAPIFLHYVTNIEDNPFIGTLLIFIICPSVTFSVGLVMTTLKARSNAYCKLNRHLCPNDLFDDIDFLKDKCCKSSATNPYEYFKLEWKFSTTFAIILLLLQIIVNFALLMLLQNRVLQNIAEKISHFRYKVPRQLYNDKKVNKEIRDIKDIMCLLKTKKFEERISLLENNSLIVDNLHKHYTAFCGDSFKAVKGISFAVKKGECLGILGPNGAGKTTALKMVAGFTVMTRGDCNVGGYLLRKDRHKYLNNISFAREDGGLDYFLSGYESLALISNLYGRPEHLTKKLVLRVLGFMGLQVFSEMKIQSYSVGCRRRLAVCATLLANPTAGLFDEPTVSVDPYTKPLVVRAIKHIRKMGTACVVAEASVDWRLLDSICSRIAIMCRGQFAAIGTASEIRTAFGSGYVAAIKLRPNTAFTIRDEDTVKVFRRSVSIKSLQNLKSSPSTATVRGPNDEKGVMCIKSATPTDPVIEFKLEFEDMFETSNLREEHLTMLYYHIEADGNLLYSEIFTKLEILKNKYDEVVEDYTLSPASIEDVFRKLENRLADKG